jgi:hypothetical protein
MWWSFQVFLGAESPRRIGNGWKNVEENKVQSANAQVSNSVIFRIKCRAQVIIGLFILVAGMLFLKRFLKELAIISILFVFVIMAAVFMVKIIFEPGLRMQFLLATIISAILAVILHFISTKSGAYGAMNELNPGMK